MIRPNRIEVDDPAQFPVQAFFNAVSDSNFVDVVQHLLQGVGYSINDAHCTFPSDLDPWETTFEGVQFSLFEESVVISVEQFRSFLKLACEAFAHHCPGERERIGLLLRGSQNAAN